MNVGEMIDLFRNYANEKKYAEDTNESALFWTTPDILQYLNQAQVHYNGLINDLDESYSMGIRDYAFPNVNNDASIVDKYTVTLPEMMQKVKLVEVLTPPEMRFGYTLRPINVVEKNRYNLDWGVAKYYFQGNQMKFLPQIPNGVVRLYYLRLLPQLKANEDICQLPSDSHENIVMYALVRALMRDKQANLAASWEKDLAMKDKWLIDLLKPRTAQEANTVLARDDWQASLYNFYG